MRWKQPLWITTFWGFLHEFILQIYAVTGRLKRSQPPGFEAQGHDLKRRPQVRQFRTAASILITLLAALWLNVGWHVLAQDVPTDPRVLIGPRVGEDAAVIDMGDRLLIAKSDPITFATDAIGHYAVTVNANDIAVMGGTPRWFLATLLLPETRTTTALVQDIFTQVHQACHELGIALIGGHTEITVGLERPILS